MTTHGQPTAGGFRYAERVRGRHVDAAGILHFAAIFRFFESAEFEFSRHLGYAPLELHPGLPRVRCSAEFKSPVRLDDELLTAVAVDHIGRTSFSLAFTSHVEDRLVATGQTTIVQADEKTGLSRPLEEGAAIRGPLERYARANQTLAEEP